MRRKNIAVLCLSLLFTVVLGTQVAASANAETQNGKPLTSPVTYFTIKGNVSYQFLKLFGLGNNIHPAANVEVTAVGKFQNVVYETQTDSNGNYTITTQVGGQFLVAPSGGKSKFYAPPFAIVHANHPGQKTDVDFKGFAFP
ncbi:MAG: carboxypeptidase-like regulatory domain-containing protein [Candidatus Levyibacteriota bacterium]